MYSVRSIIQQQVLYLSSRLDEVKSQASENESREARCLEKLERVKGELEAKDTQNKMMEAELQRKWKLIEQARVREDKLVHKLQNVSMSQFSSPWEPLFCFF